MGGSGNKLVPILGALAVAFVLFAFMRPGRDQGTPAVPSGPRTAPAPDADTGADTLRAMAEQIRAMREENDATRKENGRLRQEQADKLAALRTELENRQAAARQEDRTALAGRLDDMLRRMPSGPPAGPVPAGAAVGIPAPGPDELPALPVGGGVGQPAIGNGLVWVEPLDRSPAGAAPTALPPVAAAPQPPADPANGGLLRDGAAPTADIKPPQPAHTVPRNATLLGSTALTALIGRVPDKGQIEDPFPFKVLAGRENLAANGLAVPGVFGMVFSGTAFGDWTLGCVRGNVDSVTFVFDDGTVRTLPDALPSGGGQAGQGGNGQTGAAGPGAMGSGMTVHRGLGWISDQRGIPCVGGQRISNATDFLAGRILARAVEAAGKAFSRTQQTISTTPLGGTTSSVTGNAGQFALGETVSGGADELADFIAERQARQFDVIYVDTGAEVAVHLDHELRIDYEPDGRRLDYAHSTPHQENGRGGLD